MPLSIDARRLHKSFGDTRAVDGVDLRVSTGEIYGLVGPDGAGKTTTIRLLCGAMLPDRNLDGEPASIQVGDYDMLAQTEQARSQIGYLPQRFSLYDELTVLENIRFFAEVRGLAAALVHRPKVLLLDEPTTGVDPVTRQDFWQLIIRLVAMDEQDAVTVLVSTPYMDEAARCHRVGFMRGGRLVLEGTPEQLRMRLEKRILELRGKPLMQLRRLSEAVEGVENVQMFGDRLHLRVQEGKTQGVIASLEQAIPQAGGEISLLRPIQPQLEDVFISLLENPHA
jgi:ABC-2 type transport system ATP-binding protein